MNMELVAADGPSTTTFMDIPWDLKRSIVKELDVFSFFRLRGCSTDSVEICDNSRYTVGIHQMRLSNSSSGLPTVCWFNPITSKSSIRQIELSQLPATYRLHVQTLLPRMFSDRHCEIFDGRNVRINTLCVLDKIECEPEKFNKFLMDHLVGKIHCTSHSTPDDNPPDYDRILRLPAVIKLSSISVSMWGPGVVMESILGLRATKLRLPSIDSSTINTLLKEWQSGKRRIDSFWFGNVADSDSFNHEHDAPPRWNQDMKSLFFDGLYGVKEGEIIGRPTKNEQIQAFLPRHGSELGLCLALYKYALNSYSCVIVDYEGIRDLGRKLKGLPLQLTSTNFTL